MTRGGDRRARIELELNLKAVADAAGKAESPSAAALTYTMNPAKVDSAATTSALAP